MADDDSIEFGTLLPDGSLVNVRKLARSDMQACPHTIWVAEHYREDGTCKCDDPSNHDMIRWGYRWSEKLGRWR